MQKPSSRRRGSTVVEVVLISPWIFFLFIGALDWGFYASALISVQAAARSAALYTSSAPDYAAKTDAACSIVLDEIRKLPNIGSSTTTCDANPYVLAESITGPDGAAASKVTVRYQSIALIPIPGMLARQFTVTRIVTMRVKT